MVFLALNKSHQEQIKQWNSEKPSLKRNHKESDDDSYEPYRLSRKENLKPRKQLSAYSKVKRWLQFETAPQHSNLDSQVLNN